MTKKHSLSIFLCLIFLLLIFSEPGRPWAQEIDPAVSQALKKHMVHLAELLRGLEMQQVQDIPPDWKAVGQRLEEMNRTLKEMKETDSKGVYKEFLNPLGSDLKQMEIMAKKKNSQTFDRIAKLKNDCFNCHASHHSGGYFKGRQ